MLFKREFSRFIVLMAIPLMLSSQPCPTSKKIGNPINYVHLFKEVTDHNWNFYNIKTAFKLVLHYINAPDSDHIIVFEIDDTTNIQSKKWLYLVHI